MNHIYLSKKMRELRKQAKYTQEDVSQYLNIQRQTYCNYENDARTPPLEIIVSLSELYEVTVDYLVRSTCTERGRSAHGCPDNCAERSSARSIQEKKLLNDFAALSSAKQKEVLDFIQFKKQLPD